MSNYDMDPDIVSQGIGHFRDASDAFDTAWGNHRSALDSGVSGLGNDIITQAFLAKYKPLAEQLTGATDAIPGSFRNLCDDAQSCVDDYHAADTSGAGTIGRIASSGMGDTPAQA